MNKQVMYWISIVSRLIVASIFLSHGIQGLLLNPSLLGYFEFVGFSGSIASVMLFLTGALDTLIALLVLFKPFKLLAIWTMLWPIVPTVIAELASPTGVTHFGIHLVEHIFPGALFYLSSYTALGAVSHPSFFPSVDVIKRAFSKLNLHSNTLPGEHDLGQGKKGGRK